MKKIIRFISFQVFERIKVSSKTQTRLLGLILLMLFTFTGQAQDLFILNVGDSQIVSSQYVLTVLEIPTSKEHYILNLNNNDGSLVASLDVKITNSDGDLLIQIIDDTQENTSYSENPPAEVDGSVRYGGMFNSPEMSEMAYKAVRNYVLHRH